MPAGDPARLSKGTRELPAPLKPPRRGGAAALAAPAMLLGAAFALSPIATPALALGLGIVLALVLGNPFPAPTARLSPLLLQASVVGLGFGMPLSAVVRAGAAGIGYTAVGVSATLLAGLVIGRWLRIERQTSFLLSAGTGICGGSAIAAVGPAIGAGSAAMSVALATVFVLNAVALYLFPPVGRLLHLTQHQFALWAALAIHDTSSVVGAAAAYGPAALQEATVLKLARALWILPLSAGAALAFRRGVEGSGGRLRGVPWFIGLFVLAAVARSLAGPGWIPVLDAVSRAARTVLVLTLFLIGAGLSAATLRTVGVRPLLQGVLLWALVGGVTLAAVLRWAGGS